MHIVDLNKQNGVEVLWRRLESGLAKGDRPAAEQAYGIAARVHRGQTRKSRGSEPIPYLTHPLRVALILTEEWQRTEAAIVTAALLHDVIEDCRPPESTEGLLKEIRQRFGDEVEHGVSTLSKAEAAPGEAKSARDARYFAALAGASEWVRLVKCADRLDNLRDARAWGDRAFWIRYRSETIGRHLFLARETSAAAEAALVQALGDGEREVLGLDPLWVDGRLVDRLAVAAIPENVARRHGVTGLAIQGDSLFVGMRECADPAVLRVLALETGRRICPIIMPGGALDDAIVAGCITPRGRSSADHGALIEPRGDGEQETI